MSGHESHGHGGGHGDHGHGHGHKKEKPKQVTDDLMNEFASKTHLSDESEALRKSLASGKLTPELEKEATKRIEHEERDKYVNQLARDRMQRIVRNTKKSKEILDKKIEELEDALLEHGTAGSFHDLIEAKKKDAEHERVKLEDILEKNKENIADIEVMQRLDDARSEYAKEFKKHHKGIETKKRIENLKIVISNAGTRFSNLFLFRKKDSKKDLLEKKKSSDYETPELKAKKEAYEVARLVLANRMYERRKNELMYIGAKTRDEAIKEIKKNNPTPAYHIETRDEAIEALKLEKRPDFKLKKREKVVDEMKREYPSVFTQKTREAVIGEMLSEYEDKAENLGYSREEIQQQRFEQEDLFRLGKYDDEIDNRIEKELEAEIASGKYDTEINKRIAEDQNRQIDEYNKEQDELISKGKYDKEIEKRTKNSEASAKEAKEKFESELEEMIKSGHYDSEIERIRLESGQLDPAEQIKRLKQYKAKEILQKTFFDERKKLHEESGVPEKIAALRLWEWYAKQPPWKRRLLSTALFTAAGATGAMPFAAGMIAKYGIASYAGMKFGLSALTGGVVGNATKGIDLWNYKKDEEFKKEQARKRKESEDKFVNGEINQKKHEENLFFIEEAENQDRRKRMRIKAAVGVLLGAGMGAGAYHLIGGMMHADHDHVDPPLTKGHTFTKTPDPAPLEKTLDKSVTQVEKIAPIKSSADQISLNNNQNYEPYKILPREPAGPEIDMNPHRDILERGGPAITSDHTPAITSDFTPSNTADGVGPANSNIADQTPAAEKPPYNFGEYNPEDRNIQGYNKETGELSAKSIGDQKPENLEADTGKQLDLESGKPLEGVKENVQANNSQVGEQLDLDSGKPLGVEKENIPTGNTQGGDQLDLESGKPLEVGKENIQTNNSQEGGQLDLESGKQLDNTGAGEKAPEAPDNTTGPKAEDSTQPENSGVEGNGQTAAEYTKSLIDQSAAKTESFRTFNNASEISMKEMLTPSDTSHTRIVIEKSSPDLATAQNMINYDIRNIKAVSEDFKKVIDQKIYQDSNGYHVYEIIEIKK